jgi:hypothetical protein
LVCLLYVQLLYFAVQGSHVPGPLILTIFIMCRLDIQRRISRALQAPLLYVQQPEAPVQHETFATLNIGNPKPLYRRTLPSGEIRYVLEGNDAVTGIVPWQTVSEESEAATQLSVVVVIQNLARSFVQIQQEISVLLQTAAAIVADNSTTGSSMAARRLQQATQGQDVAPAFGVLNVSVTAQARCGNGICEFGEAVGTWGYPEAWNCPQDCPFQLTACPAQVCSSLVPVHFLLQPS